jgi:hypothetical protein
MAVTLSTLDRLKKLDEERSKLIEEAKAASLAKANEAIKELNELGLHYRLIEGAEPSRSVASAMARWQSDAPTRQQRDVPCPICGFKTTPLHDGRAHRSQDPKKPFNADELEARAMKKI